jgi:hypothetical protein
MSARECAKQHAGSRVRCKPYVGNIDDCMLEGHCVSALLSA